jgi:hypothetical protein
VSYASNDRLDCRDDENDGRDLKQMGERLEAKTDPDRYRKRTTQKIRKLFVMTD